ncbi:MAG: LysM peptidoglycan-binding domain-containing protein [Lentisphaerota bacterium]
MTAIITMQGCSTTAPTQQTVEPPPAPVMPPKKESMITPKPVIQPPVPVEAAPSMIEPSGSKVYVIQKGDSLSKIASRCGVSSREIMELNKIKDANKIMIGQKLVLPDYATMSGSVSHKPAPVKEKAASKPAKEKASKDLSGAYVVQPGDSLSKIAAKHGTTTKAIKETNQLKSDKIMVGQKLVMPGAKAETTEPKAAQPEAVPAPAPQPAPEMGTPETVIPAEPVLAPPSPVSSEPAVKTDPASQNQPLDYTVQDGETLEDIAKLFIVRKEDIVRLNNLSPSGSLKPGQKIKIPATNL